MAPAAIPPFVAVGSDAKKVLVGAPGAGLFNFDQRVSLSTKTADGVGLVFNAINTGEKGADLSLRATYNYKNYGLSSVFKTTTDKVDVTATLDKIAPGLKASVHATLPDAQSGKLMVDYANAYAHVRAVLGLTTAPKATVQALSGNDRFLYGAEGTFDTSKSEVTGYGVMLGWRAPDSAVTLQLTDKLETAKLLVSHAYTKDKTLAAEVSRPVKGGDVTFAVGLAQRLDNGALFKAKIDHAGIASLLYEQRLASGERLSLSTQLDAINVGSKAPKVGVSLDLA